jgi:hypothetical protein
VPIRYQVMNTVPENWIPFIPVHVPGDSRTIQLQRAGLPRILDGDPDPPGKVQPRTVLLREGLDRSPAQTFFVFEEEVPRAGAQLMQCFERTRWRDGRVYTWLRVASAGRPRRRHERARIRQAGRRAGQAARLIRRRHRPDKGLEEPVVMVSRLCAFSFPCGGAWTIVMGSAGMVKAPIPTTGGRRTNNRTKNQSRRHRMRRERNAKPYTNRRKS